MDVGTRITQEQLSVAFHNTESVGEALPYSFKTVSLKANLQKRNLIINKPKLAIRLVLNALMRVF